VDYKTIHGKIKNYGLGSAQREDMRFVP
jgi:hypothetical protein